MDRTWVTSRGIEYEVYCVPVARDLLGARREEATSSINPVMAQEIILIASEEALAISDYKRPVCAERSGWWLAINRDVPRSRADEILEEVARASE